MSVIELITELTQQDIRLWLEDGQLRFSAPKSGMSDATRELLKKNKADVIAFLSQSQSNTDAFILDVDKTALQPLSYAQERIWFLSQLEPDNQAFHLPIIFDMQGPLDIPLLERVLNLLVARHSILRTAYVQTATGTYQKILPEKTVTLNLRRVDHADLTNTQLEDIARQETRRPFDLERGDVTHNLLLAMPGQRHVLFFTSHHIATDGWSMAIIGQEIAQLYSTLSQQDLSPAALPLPQPAIEYVDFAVWQREHLQKKPLQVQLDYWRNLLKNHHNIQLPTDFPRPALTQSHGASLKFMINASDTAQLNLIARDNNTTLFAVLLSLFGTLLYRYTQQASFCIGTPVAGRLNSQCESLVGCFLNLLAIQMENDSNETFLELLERNRATVQSAFAHQEVPFEEVVKAVVTTRNLSLTPIFQVMFSFQNTPFEKITDIANIRITPVEPEKHAALYDITLTAKEWGGEIYAEFDYKTDLFKAESMQAFTENFQHLIASVIANPNNPVGALDFVTTSDKQQQLNAWNKTGRPRDTQCSIAGLIDAQAIQTPDAIAIRYKNNQLSYRNLNEQANQLAHFLISQGIQPGTLLGVFLERSLQLPVTLLAILKAGAVYVPLDLSFPEERLNTIARDARLQWIITSRYLSLWKFPAALQVIDIEQTSQWLALDKRTPPITPDSSKPLLNVIYTSGSTGQPKGVMVSQAAIVNRLLWMQETFPLQAHDRVLHKTPYSFDVSVWEIFWPLIAGAQLIIAEPQGHKNPAYLRDIIYREKISILHFVPSMLSVFLQTDAPGKCASLKEVFCSGEVLSLELAKHFYAQLPNATLVNLYGPTEAAIDVSCYKCSKQSLNVPIGKPISNTQLYVLDQRQRLLPIGAVGEIVIGGSGLAEGYIHQPELTAQAFIDNPFQPGTRLYKTGDLGRFDQEGQLHFIGRADQQIKVRGFRVELGEIESQLNRHPAIRESLIVANALDNNHHQIIAYYIAKTAVDASSLRHYLTTLLPSFMIPNAFIELKAWPLTYNGKIDRNALPDPDRESLHTQPFVPPRNPLEKNIAKIWSELLNIERIGIYDNFFELGGHSLLATLAITRMQNTFNVKIPLSAIFKEPTVANFAQAILLAQQTQPLLKNAEKPGSDNGDQLQ